MIATGTAIALSLMAGAQTGAQIYGQKSANAANKRAQTLQSQETNTAAAIERERLAEERATRVSAEARDKERWQDYLRINEPHWKAGAGVLSSLYDLAGMQGGAPAYAQPAMPVTPPQGLPPANMSGTAPVTAPQPRRYANQPSAVQPLPIAELMQLAAMGSTPSTKATMSGMPVSRSYA